MPLISSATAKWCVFFLARTAVYCMLPMQWSQAYTRMHHLDIWELRHNCVEALWNLNCQPPLYNAWIACVAKIFPDSIAGVACQTQHLLLSALAFSVFMRIMTRLKVSEPIATCATYAYALLPTLLFAERWLTYTFPVSAFLLIASYLLIKWHDEGRTPHLCAYFLCLLIIALTRSLYHPIVWLIPCALAAVKRGHLKKTILIAIPTITLSLVPNILNFARYGMFTNSTWQGMNLFRTMHYVTRAEKEREINRGTVSRIVLLAPIFEKNETYMEYLGERITKTGIPVLDNVEKSSSETNRGGERNSNATFMVELSKDYQKSWKCLLKRYPLRYVQSVINSTYEFFSLDVYRSWGNRRDWLPHVGNAPLVFVVRLIRAIILPALIMAAFFLSIFGYLKRSFPLSSATPALLFSAYTLCLTAAVSSLCEAGETSIMRVSIEPLVLIGTALALTVMSKRVIRVRDTATSGGEGIRVWSGHVFP